eukprot:Rhum_TRINITY_DN16711_c0_g1::Rhum_TRINITY_DN16711_c0_g1_i1::g.164114::m.164114
MACCVEGGRGRGEGEAACTGDGVNTGRGGWRVGRGKEEVGRQASASGPRSPGFFLFFWGSNVLFLLCVRGESAFGYLFSYRICFVCCVCVCCSFLIEKKKIMNTQLFFFLIFFFLSHRHRGAVSALRLQLDGKVRRHREGRRHLRALGGREGELRHVLGRAVRLHLDEVEEHSAGVLLGQRQADRHLEGEKGRCGGEHPDAASAGAQAKVLRQRRDGHLQARLVRGGARLAAGGRVPHGKGNADVRQLADLRLLRSAHGRDLTRHLAADGGAHAQSLDGVLDEVVLGATTDEDHTRRGNDLTRVSRELLHGGLERSGEGVAVGVDPAAAHLAVEVRTLREGLDLHRALGTARHRLLHTLALVHQLPLRPRVVLDVDPRLLPELVGKVVEHNLREVATARVDVLLGDDLHETAVLVHEGHRRRHAADVDDDGGRGRGLSVLDAARRRRVAGSGDQRGGGGLDHAEELEAGFRGGLCNCGHGDGAVADVVGKRDDDGLHHRSGVRLNLALGELEEGADRLDERVLHLRGLVVDAGPGDDADHLLAVLAEVQVEAELLLPDGRRVGQVAEHVQHRVDDLLGALHADRLGRVADKHLVLAEGHAGRRRPVAVGVDNNVRAVVPNGEAHVLVSETETKGLNGGSLLVGHSVFGVSVKGGTRNEVQIL